LREILRRDVLPRLDEAGLALDVLVRARREAYDARFAELREELVRWTARRLSRPASSSWSAPTSEASRPSSRPRVDMRQADRAKQQRRCRPTVPLPAARGPWRGSRPA